MGTPILSNLSADGQKIWVYNVDYCEHIEGYVQGGYCPIHLDDRLGPDGRYRVMHKLGAGGDGTVWLCRDIKYAGYVAVKVHKALRESSNSAFEEFLSSLAPDSPGRKLLAVPLDKFTVDSPNGTHECIVLPVLGPRVFLRVGRAVHDSEKRKQILHKVCYQSTLAMAFLHDNGFCHGDFQPENILSKLVNLDSLSERELMKTIRTPHIIEVETEPGRPLPPSCPQYLVDSVSLVELIEQDNNKYLSDDMCLINFDRVYPMSSPSPPSMHGVMEDYWPPERLLEEMRFDIMSKDNPALEEPALAAGLACDLWALGCTIFEIKVQVGLLYWAFLNKANNDYSWPLLFETLPCLIDMLGPLPSDLSEKWEWCSQRFDKSKKRVGQWSETRVPSLEELVAFWESEDHEVLDDELSLFVDMLRKLFRYNPEERMSARELLEHKWFAF